MTDQRRNNDILLGELIAEAKSSKDQRSLLFEKLDDMSVVLLGLNATIPPLVERVNDNSESIGTLNKFKQRIYIGIAAIGGTGGVVGSLTTNIFKKIGLS